MVDNQIEFPEITTDEAVKIIIERNGLSGVTIQNFRDVMEELIKKAPDKPLMISECIILDCVCNRLEIPNEFTIHHSVFAREANFGGAIFKGETVISYVDFDSSAMFRCAVFEHKARFTKTNFIRYADFGWTEFKDDVSFSGAQFLIKSECHCHFDKSRIHSLCDFTGAEFGKSTRIDFSNIDIRPGGCILLDINQIGKHQLPLCFSKSIRNNLIAGEDSSDSKDLKSAASQYNILRDNFNALPSKDEEEGRCHYKYKDLTRRATKGKQLWKLWDWTIMKWCLGYGIYTKRILFAGLALITAFAGVYHFFATELLIKNFDCEFNPLYFSVITFTTIGYGDYAPLGWLRIIAGVEGLLGLIVIAVFTVSFARKLIR